MAAAKSIAVRERLLLAHDGLALRAARRYRCRGVDPEDLAQEARLGLLRASQRFDPARGVSFAAYASWWVRRSLQDALRRHVPPPGAARQAIGPRAAVAMPCAALPEAAERVRACLRRLPPAEAAVLRLRYGLDGCAPRTAAAVARQFDLTRGAVRRIERRALARLERLYADYERRDAE